MASPISLVVNLEVSLHNNCLYLLKFVPTQRLINDDDDDDILHGH